MFFQITIFRPQFRHTNSAQSWVKCRACLCLAKFEHDFRGIGINIKKGFSLNINKFKDRPKRDIFTLFIAEFLWDGFSVFEKHQNNKFPLIYCYRKTLV